MKATVRQNFEYSHVDDTASYAGYSKSFDMHLPYVFMNAIIAFSTFDIGIFLFFVSIYSRTSRKRPTKMPRFSGGLQEVVAYSKSIYCIHFPCYNTISARFVTNSSS